VNGGGIVTGLIQGLPSNGTGAATSVQVLNNTNGFGIGEYVGNPLTNFFAVADGVITQAQFMSFGVNNQPPAVTDSSLGILYIPQQSQPQNEGLTHSPSLISFNNAPIQFTPANSVPEPSDILGTLAFGAIGASYLLKRKNWNKVRLFMDSRDLEFWWQSGGYNTHSD